MKVKKLREALQGMHDEAEVMLYDHDSGDNYQPKELQKGLVRKTTYKNQVVVWSFGSHIERLQFSLADIQKHGIDTCEIYHAIVVL